MNTVLYIFKATNIPTYKIGITNNLVARLESIKNMSPVPIRIYEVFRTLVDPLKVEKDLHKHFNNERSHGEWFNLTRQQVKTINKLVREFDKESLPRRKKRNVHRREYDMSYKEIIEKYEELYNSDIKVDVDGDKRKRPYIATLLNITDGNLGRLLYIHNNKPELIKVMDDENLSINEMYQFCKNPH